MCIRDRCNREVKTGFLAQYLRKVVDIDKLATGHYSRLVEDIGKRHKGRARDKRRDQSYFLSLVKREHLEFLEFPLGDLTIEEVRKIAKERGLPVWDKRDSQDVCFLIHLLPLTQAQGRSPLESQNPLYLCHLFLPPQPNHPFL